MKPMFRIMIASALLTGAAPVTAQQTARDRLIAYLTAEAARQTQARAATLALITTPEQARARQARVRAAIADLIRLESHAGPVVSAITDRGSGDGYSFEKLWYESLPNYRVSAIVYRPTGKGPFPAIIVQPGHGVDGKIGDHPLAAHLARSGFLVLSIDIVGEGERLQHYDPPIGASKVGRPTGEHSMSFEQALPTGGHVSRFFIQDAMRGVDYLMSRSDVDDARIGAFGCSGGGTITAYLAALDPRVRATVVGCYVNDYAHLLGPGGPGPQDGEQSIPFFLERGLDLADWVEAVAPRPFAVVSTQADIFPIAGARAAYAEARRFYAASGAPDAITMIEGPGGHGNLGPIMPRIVGYFSRALKGDPAEHPYRPEPIGDPARLLVANGAVGGATLQQMIAAEAPAPPRPSREALADAIRDIARVTVSPGGAPPVVTLGAGVPVGDHISASLAFDAAPGLRVDGSYVRGASRGKRPTLLLLSAQPQPTIDAWTRAGWNVLALEPRGAGGTEEPKSPLTGDWTLLSLRALLVGRTPVGMRTDDALAALNWLAGRSEVGRIVVQGSGPLGPVALHVGVLDLRVAGVISDSAITRYREFVERPISRDMAEVNLPGVLTRYDLPDLMVALGDRLTLINPKNAVGEPLDAIGLAKLNPARPRVVVRAMRDPITPFPFR
jgi:cephalosporin-C deacetylase-like acetyl esterase